MSRIRANLITNQSADGSPTVENGLIVTGISTATTFAGSGANLTTLPAGQLTGYGSRSTMILMEVSG